MINFILNNFDTIFKNETSLETLDKLILDLAIKGKLVEQDPNDEPASELIKRIKAEKEQLIKEKVIKKEKPLPPIEEDEIPFDIPSSWEWVRLGEIGFKITDGSHNPPIDSKKGYPMFSAKNIINGKLDYSNPDRYVTLEEFKKENIRTNIKKGDILLSIVGSIGKSCIVEEEQTNFIVQRSICVLDIPIIKKYIIVLLNSQFLITQMLKKAKGTAQLGIYLNSIKGLLLPLPPIEEQKRIVSKVEKLQSIIKDLKEIYIKNQNNRENLKNSLLSEIESQSNDKELLKNLEIIFANFDKIIKTKEDIKDIRNLILSLAIKGKLVGQNPSDEPASELLKRIKSEKQRLIDEKIIKKEKPLPPIEDKEIPFDIPNNWEWVRFVDLCSVLTCGYASTPKYEKTGKAFISAKNVKPYKFLLDDYKFISEELYSKLTANTKPEKGDILLTRVGAGIGEATIIDVDLDFAIYVSLTLIKLIKNKVVAKYILLYINSPFFRELMIESTFGKNTSQGNLNVKKLRELPIPLPPIEEQKRIVSKVESLMKICDLLEEKITLNEKISDKLLESILKN